MIRNFYIFHRTLCEIPTNSMTLSFNPDFKNVKMAEGKENIISSKSGFSAFQTKEALICSWNYVGTGFQQNNLALLEDRGYLSLERALGKRKPNIYPNLNFCALMSFFIEPSA